MLLAILGRSKHKQRDVENCPGDGAGKGQKIDVDCGDPSWPILWHRPNIIIQITQPQENPSWSQSFRYSLGRRSGKSTTTGHGNPVSGPEPPQPGSLPSSSDATPEEGQNRQPEKLSSCIHAGHIDNAHRENANHGEPEERLKSFRVNFAEMQRIHMLQLQRKLVQHAVHLEFRPGEPEDWAGDLRRYGKCQGTCASWAFRAEDSC